MPIQSLIPIIISNTEFLIQNILFRDFDNLYFFFGKQLKNFQSVKQYPNPVTIFIKIFIPKNIKILAFLLKICESLHFLLIQLNKNQNSKKIDWSINYKN